MLTVAILGCVVLLVCWVMLNRVSDKMRAEFESEIRSLTASVRALEEARSGQATSLAGAPAANVQSIQTLTREQPPQAAHFAREISQISEETQDVVKAKLFASLGHEVRVRSVKLVETVDEPTGWTTQGRVAVHTSHNQRMARD